MLVETKIRTIDVNEFEHRVEQVNKIAKRLGVEPISFEYGEESHTIKQTQHGKVKEYWVEITITGEYPSYKGYEFVAQLDHVDGLVRSLNTTSSYRHLIGDTTCAHCGTKRFRNTTYVITKDGEEMQVGGSCLKYYIPTKTTHSLSSFYSSIAGIADDFQGSGSFDSSYSVEEVVAWSLVFAQERGGYIKIETRAWVNNMLTGTSIAINQERREMMDKYDLDEYKERAAEILEWLKEQPTNSDYISNLQALADNKYTTTRNFGYVCSIIAAHDRDMVKRREFAKKQEVAVTSEHVGTVKKREEFTLTLEKLTSVSGYYGDTFIHNFTDEAGNLIVWFGTKRLTTKSKENLEVGETIKVKATVKEHGIYNDAKQTKLTRVTAI